MSKVALPKVASPKVALPVAIAGGACNCGSGCGEADAGAADDGVPGACDAPCAAGRCAASSWRKTISAAFMSGMAAAGAWPAGIDASVFSRNSPEPCNAAFRSGPDSDASIGSRRARSCAAALCTSAGKVPGRTAAIRSANNCERLPCRVTARWAAAETASASSAVNRGAGNGARVVVAASTVACGASVTRSAGRAPASIAGALVSPLPTTARRRPSAVCETASCRACPA